MPLFRKDPFGHAWVLLSPERGLEPSDFGSVPPPQAVSPLSPGHEGRISPEITSVRPSASRVDDPDWRMRVIGHPAKLLTSQPYAEEGEKLFTQATASGHQEIIVEHPDARETLDGMPRNHLIDVLRLYRDRIALHSSRPGIRHVQLTRNVGKAAGALFDHPHAQLLAVPVANRWVEEEMEVANTHYAGNGSCIFCDVLARELAQRQRVITYNDEFVAVAPFASKTPFETWIFPRRHSSSFASVAANNLPHLAEILQLVIRGINDALDRPPYNLALHTAPNAELPAYHWHIEILPRLTSQAGFDWGAGFFVNPTPPEDAARFLREALALQQVSG